MVAFGGSEPDSGKVFDLYSLWSARHASDAACRSLCRAENLAADKKEGKTADSRLTYPSVYFRVRLLVLFLISPLYSQSK